MLQNKLTTLLGINYPIIQAPMAGGITVSKLVSEVSHHGGLGMIGAGYMTPDQLREQIKEIRKLTTSPFGVNLFVPNDFSLDENQLHKAHDILQPFRAKLNLALNDQIEIPDDKLLAESFHNQISVIIEEKVPVCSFTFGIPSSKVISLLKQNDTKLIATATTVEEAEEIEKSGFDMVVVQGSEAGGHRGNFIREDEGSLVGLMSLIPQAADCVNIPVIAAGGIMDGRGLIASLCLGAAGVQMGTAFLTCVESGAHRVYKEAILDASEDQTVLTRSFSGKMARGIENRYIRELREYEGVFPGFPVQNALTQEIRKASSAQNNPEYMSLWSGQSPRLAKNQNVGALMENIMEEALKIKSKFYC
ncbi:nitronate monooxygenase [Mesobacillus campisalis]|uniref:Probable nitronate monooxygenase n=1 Tax=Mesobacillus campisalis TaxID=1408103 RepID=A0A0M2T1E1_9BACI|nr:nitronate monooxygenase [Mesobacillus campisalis]KKK38635.1 nitronate monooxygenase [Mesobacillus campisalis]